jgi:hypothetical protein
VNHPVPGYLAWYSTPSPRRGAMTNPTMRALVAAALNAAGAFENVA